MYNCETDLPRSEQGLREYSFEIGPMDDTSEAVAIVGIEYSSVGFDEVFYRKEETDSLIAEKDEEIAALKARNHRLLNRIVGIQRALCLLRSNNAMGEFLYCDHVDEGNPELWIKTRDYWKNRAEEMKNEQ